jgi:hydrogenase-4 component F
MAIVWVLALPVLAALSALLPLGRRGAAAVTVATSLVGTTIASLVVARAARGVPVIAVPGWLSCDGLSAVVLWLVSFVGLVAALFSWGYMERLVPQAGAGKLRRYYLGFNLFLLSMLAVPALAQVAMVWIAVALTTLLSAFLVGFHGTSAAMEAAWKYVVLTSLGAIVALFGVFVLYWAASAAGVGFTWSALADAAPLLPPTLVLTALLFVLVGFGTKAGLVPMHAWLPDAYSQAPLPVCILLSGGEASATLYVLLRLLPIGTAAGVEAGGWAIGLGLLTSGFAVLLLLRAQDIKRLLAFSTVEHMGIILMAAGLGGQDASSAALYQLVGHALAKSLCFLAAGLAVLAAGTRQMGGIRGLIRISPVAGVSLLVGGLAISGVPPFALFVSEMSILRAGIGSAHYVATGLLGVIVVVGFCAVMMRVNRMVFGDAPGDGESTRLPASGVAAIVVVVAPLLIAGLYLPEVAQQVLGAATSTLGGP